MKSICNLIGDEFHYLFVCYRSDIIEIRIYFTITE